LAENFVFFLPLFYSVPPLGPLPMFSLEFHGEVIPEETRVMGLLVVNVAWS